MQREGRRTVGGGAEPDSVRVCCRVRPLSLAEEKVAGESCVAFNSQDPQAIECSIKTSGGASGAEKHSFSFSRVFAPDRTQREVYEDVALPVLRDVLNGYNGTIFMYGQTGSGKTHTMFGKGHHPLRRQSTASPRELGTSVTTADGEAPRQPAADDEDDTEDDDDAITEGGEDAEEVDAHGTSLRSLSVISPLSPSSMGAEAGAAGQVKARTNSMMTASSVQTGLSLSRVGEEVNVDSGIIPRVIDDLFQSIYSGDSNTEYQVRVFFVEVYMEGVYDLLGGAAAKLTDLRVREDVETNSFYIENCVTPSVGSPEDIMEIVRYGLRRRKTSATQMNKRSSRSHCILNITVTSLHQIKKESKVGKLFLVDLAGSEKVAKSKAAGLRLEEAKQINKSLSSLGNVIVALTDPKATHVPYRDSVLTKILKDSLGGNSKTTLVICCSPSAFNAAETLSTLRFGQRAKNIKNKAVINRQLTVEQLQQRLGAALDEIKRLKGVLTQTGGLSVGELQASTTRQLDDLIEERAAETRKLNEVIATTHELRDQLRAAEERIALLTSEGDALKKAERSLQAECRLWEESYAALQRVLKVRDGAVHSCHSHIRTQETEIAVLIEQLESSLGPLVEIEAALKEQRAASEEGAFASTMSRRRRDTIIALEGGARGGSGSHSRARAASTFMAMPPLSPFTHVGGSAPSPNIHVNSSTSMNSPAPKFRAFEPSEAADEPGPPQRRRSVSSLLRSPSAQANFDVLERAAEERQASSASRTPSPPNLGIDGTQGAPAADAEHANEEVEEGGEEEEAPGRLSSFAARRILQLEEQLNTMEIQAIDAKNAHGVLASELQLAQKKLQTRQNRIDNLKYLLKQEVEGREALLVMLEKERQKSREHLEEAYAEVNFWRRRWCEEGPNRNRSSRASITTFEDESEDSSHLASARGGLAAAAAAAAAEDLTTPGRPRRHSIVQTHHILRPIQGGSTPRMAGMTPRKASIARGE